MQWQLKLRDLAHHGFWRLQRLMFYFAHLNFRLQTALFLLQRADLVTQFNLALPVVDREQPGAGDHAHQEEMPSVEHRELLMA